MGARENRAVKRAAPASRSWIFFATAAIAGCGGGSSGGEQVAVTPPAFSPQCRLFVVDKDDPTASDGNDGRYARDGGTGPWRTISHALDMADACDTIRVRAASTPYRESMDGTPAGIVIARGGEPGKPIVIEGYPGERPIIDQQQSGSEAVPVAGFVLRCVSWITLRNFELRNIGEAGVSSSLEGCNSGHITLENLVIHDVFGGNLVAGIRLAGVSDVVLENNRVENIVKVRDDPGPAVAAGRDACRGIRIGRNTISAVEAGIVASLQTGNALSELAIDHNRIYQAATAVSLLPGEIDGAFSQVDVFGNVFHDVETSLAATAIASGALTIHNNTFAHHSGAAVVVDGFGGVALYNNIFFRIGDDFLKAGATARFDLVDFNLYWSPGGSGWTLGGASPRTYNVLQDWQSAYSAEMPDALRADPDGHGLAEDPLFVDGDRSDFRIQPDSAATLSGYGGISRGAYFDQGAVGAAP